MSNQWVAFWSGPNRWARAHPWQWALIGAVAWFVLGWSLSQHLWFGLMAAGVGFVVMGLSMSSWPGRRYLEWRHRERP